MPLFNSEQTVKGRSRCSVIGLSDALVAYHDQVAEWHKNYCDSDDLALSPRILPRENSIGPQLNFGVNYADQDIQSP